MIFAEQVSFIHSHVLILGDHCEQFICQKFLTTQHSHVKYLTHCKDVCNSSEMYGCI